MKKLFCLAVLLFAALGALAQEKPLEKSEFDSIIKNSYGKFAGKSYRQTENSRDVPLPNSPPVITTKLIREFAARSGMRMVSEFDSPTIKTKKETILIDGVMYVREGEGAWTIKTVQKPEPRESKLKTIEEQTEYKALGTEKLGDRTASVYAKIERKKLFNEERNQEMSTITTTKYWLDESGGLIKQETLHEGRIKNNKIPKESVYQNLRTTLWELDPTIKIEAPIVTQ